MSDELLQALAPLFQHLSEVDPSDPTAAAALNRDLPVSSEGMQVLFGLLKNGLSDGTLTPRGEEGMRYGRVCKSSGDTHDFSVDAVHMNRPGPGHAHPRGEINVCFATGGDPAFDGEPPGWVVKAPGTWHVPTVQGGEMVILYFLPGGAIEFGPDPSASPSAS
jgi:hypothetical protein